ncbi:hypothetical protein MKK58_09435 [Methylobacterium sp. J-078]|uniref:hypothetical protein n=1 Tax=Methylobacterium sp. J-078 TaxID=2836657 RepID=UPI001FB935D8|nr:hypothetical protein [Methylobacterium sp. J-078]MCJ2044748.1 hypothetical protein [Methylobacterium sp. J-078]
MSDDVLKTFQLALGFKMDGNQQAKFEGAITSAVTKANLAAAALIEAAKAAAQFAAGIVSSFDQLYYASGRTGATVQNIKALQYAFSQVGGSAQSANAAIEAFAKAQRTNPGVKQYIKDLGVKETGDAVTDLIASVDKIREKNPYASGALMAGLLGISEEQFNLFDKNADKIKAKMAEINSLRRVFGVDSQKVAKQSADFSAALGTLGSVVTVAGEALTSIMLPAIEKISGAVTRWLNAHPELVQTVFQGIETAVTAASTAFGMVIDKGTELFGYLSDRAAEMTSDGSFLRMWEKVVDVFEKVATAIKSVMTWLAELDRATDMSAGLNAIKRLLGWVEGKTTGFVEGGAAAAGAVDRATQTGVGVPGSAVDDKKPGLLRRGLSALKGALGVGSASAAVSDRTPLGPVPPGLLDNIARAEGTYRTGYDTSLGHGRFLPGGKEVKLTQMTLSQIKVLGDFMRRQPGNPNSSALGRYQIVGSTMKDAAKALGMDMDQTNFDAATQDRMAHWIARRQGLGAWEGFKNHPAERAAAAAALARQDLAGGTNPTQRAAAIPAPGFTIPKGFGPGSFDVNRLGAAPLGSSTVNNTAGATVTMAPVTNIKIDGASDPASVGAAVERAQGRANDLSLRNAQSAIR